MIIDFEFAHECSKEDLMVWVQTPNKQINLNLKQQVKSLRVDFELPLRNQIVTIAFCCDNPRIMDFPLLITNIVLDNFYQSAGILHNGIPVFDQQFLELSKQNNIYLDHTINDSNRLDFTGKLLYQYIWPFYKNIFQ